MTVSELSDPASVLSAIKYCDEIGRDTFLRRHGFGESRIYFLEYGGRRYDCEAIVGVAHKMEFGGVLQAADFKGGERTVARKLNDLGFIVTHPAPGWSVPIGRLTTRTAVAAEYGGAIYGGIEPSTTSPNVMVYSDPSEGEQHGYHYDGWVEDEAGVFTYTGEGRLGHQTLTNGNRAILEHASQGRTLRLFFTLPGPAQAGGKTQRYIGAFKVDPESPYEWRIAPDGEGTQRKVVVFHFLPDEVDGYPQSPVAHPSVPVVRRQAPQERQFTICPTCTMALPATGVCDFCE